MGFEKLVLSFPRGALWQWKLVYSAQFELFSPGNALNTVLVVKQAFF